MNHSCFHEVKQYTIETPITNPLPYPINTNFQSNSLVEPCLEDESVGGDASELSHALDKGLPHNPGFPSKEACKLISLWYMSCEMIVGNIEELKECHPC